MLEARAEAAAEFEVLVGCLAARKIPRAAAWQVRHDTLGQTLTTPKNAVWGDSWPPSAHLRAKLTTTELPHGRCRSRPAGGAVRKSDAWQLQQRGAADNDEFEGPCRRAQFVISGLELISSTAGQRRTLPITRFDRGDQCSGLPNGQELLAPPSGTHSLCRFERGR